MTENWTHEKVIRLVNLYESKPELWDPTNNSYHLKNKKYDAWQEIANNLTVPMDSVKSKITSLLSSFRREKAKMKMSHGTGKGRNEIYVSKWFAFDSFKFLLEKDTVKSSINTLEETANLEESESDVEVQATENSEEVERDIVETANEDVFHNIDQDPLTDTIPKRKTFYSSKKLPLKKKSKIEKQGDNNVSAAYELLRTVANKSNNECSTYGQYVGIKLQTFDPRLRSIVIHQMNNILFQAEIGLINTYNLIPTATQQSHNVQCTNTVTPPAVSPSNQSLYSEPCSSRDSRSYPPSPQAISLPVQSPVLYPVSQTQNYHYPSENIPLSTPASSAPITSPNPQTPHDAENHLRHFYDCSKEYLQ